MYPPFQSTKSGIKAVLLHLQGGVKGERMVSSWVSRMITYLFSVWASG